MLRNKWVINIFILFICVVGMPISPFISILLFLAVLSGAGESEAKCLKETRLLKKHKRLLQEAKKRSRRYN